MFSATCDSERFDARFPSVLVSFSSMSWRTTAQDRVGRAKFGRADGILSTNRRDTEQSFLYSTSRKVWLGGLVYTVYDSSCLQQELPHHQELADRREWQMRTLYIVDDGTNKWELLVLLNTVQAGYLAIRNLLSIMPPSTASEVLPAKHAAQLSGAHTAIQPCRLLASSTSKKIPRRLPHFHFLLLQNTVSVGEIFQVLHKLAARAALRTSEEIESRSAVMNIVDKLLTQGSRVLNQKTLILLSDFTPSQASNTTTTCKMIGSLLAQLSSSYVALAHAQAERRSLQLSRVREQRSQAREGCIKM